MYLSVGPGQQYSTIHDAIAASHDGDVVNVQAGLYTDDISEITTKITLNGVGGMVHMVATLPPINDKAILVTDTDVTINHFEFSGAHVVDTNGAGIRYQGGNLILTNDYFHDNQEGLLGAASSTGTITVRNSEFARNGSRDGLTHNIYVGDIKSLLIDHSYFHDANGGHEIKSRAESTTITNTRVVDHGSDASYSIDMPNAGHTVLNNNTIQKGPNSPNNYVIAYGEEGNLHATKDLHMSGNVVDSQLSSATLLWNATRTTALVDHTTVWGIPATQMKTGPATFSSTTRPTTEPAIDSTPIWTSNPSDSVTHIGDLIYADGVNHTITGTPSGDDVLYADNSGDTIRIGDGNSIAYGGAGNDIIYAGAGNDDISGGWSGNDRFVFMPNLGNDRIEDFLSHTDPAAGQGLIDISAFGITAATFTANVSFHDTDHGSAMVTFAGLSGSIDLLWKSAADLNASDFILAH